MHELIDDKLVVQNFNSCSCLFAGVLVIFMSHVYPFRCIEKSCIGVVSALIKHNAWLGQGIFSILNVNWLTPCPDFPSTLCCNFDYDVSPCPQRRVAVISTFSQPRKPPKYKWPFVDILSQDSAIWKVIQGNSRPTTLKIATKEKLIMLLALQHTPVSEKTQFTPIPASVVTLFMLI